MNETTQNEYYQSNLDSVCKNCQIVPALPDSLSQLCATCRKEFVRYPVPKWVQVFCVILLILLFEGVLRVYPMLSTAVDLGKAQKAIEANKYITAERILKTVIARQPDFVEAKHLLMIAACYNQEGELAGKLFAELRGEQLDLNGREIAQTEIAKSFLNAAYALDSGIVAKIEAAEADSSIALQQLFELVDTAELSFHEVAFMDMDERLNSEFLIANRMYTLGFYEECSSMLGRILKRNPKHYYANGLMAVLNRKAGKYDAALRNCDTMLTINCEDIRCLSMKAKIELSKKNTAKAKEYANEAYRLGPENPFALEAQTLVFWFIDQPLETQKYLNLLKMTEPDSPKVMYLRTAKIINGVEPFN